MTGPEHYREAERLIEEANHAGHSDPQRGDGIVAAAQVHAILALADAQETYRELHGKDAAITHDAGRQVEAVLDVIAPKTGIRAVMAAYGNDGDPDDIEAALGPDIRVPIILLDCEGHAVRPSDAQLRVLAEEIVTAIRTAGGPS